MGEYRPWYKKAAVCAGKNRRSLGVSGEEERKRMWLDLWLIPPCFRSSPGVRGIRNNQKRFSYMRERGTFSLFLWEQAGISGPLREGVQQTRYIPDDRLEWLRGALHRRGRVSSSSIQEGQVQSLWRGQHKELIGKEKTLQVSLPVGFSSRYQKKVHCPGKMRNSLTEVREGWEPSAGSTLRTPDPGILFSSPPHSDTLW